MNACLLLLPLTAAATDEGRLFVDQLGREVRVSGNPRRIVSLAPSITEIVFALGEGERVKGVTDHCDFPPEAQSLPRVGSYVHPDLERIVALKPDLCIATRDGNPREAVERLDALGIAVFVVNPKDLDTIVQTLLDIGRLLNVSARAEELAAQTRKRIERVKARVAKTANRPGVFFQIGVVPIVGVGTDTFFNELITAAGGRNLTKGPLSYPRFTREQVLAMQPDVIIISSMTRGESFEKVRDEWKQWDNLPAVQTGSIHIVDSNLFDRPTPRLVDALETLARLVHPELQWDSP